MVGSRLTALASIATGFVLTASVVAGSIPAISGTTEVVTKAETASLVIDKPASPSKAIADPNDRPAKTEQPRMFGTEIPEPSNFMMLALGIAGLVAGRWAAGHRGKNKAD